MQDRLVFLISAPRSGSTLLARMLGAHPAIHAPVEPHLMPPLAHLGFHERVDAAPYDPVITQRGLRAFVTGLPGGEADWLDALRAATDHLYARALAGSGAEIFLDKTPAYALVLPFLAKLYPDARFLVLTRHPLAIWCSVVDSFYDGDAVAAHRHNPILERYVPAIARFLREPPARCRRLAYESLVAEPEREARGLADWLGVPFRPELVEYGRSESGARAAERGLGDPVTVAREARPTTASVASFRAVLAAEPARLAQAREIVARLPDEDLAGWGHPRASLEAELASIEPAGASRRRARLSRHTLERRALVAVRKRVQREGLLARCVRGVREVCDVLLR